MAAQPPSVMQSRYFPKGVRQYACGFAARYAVADLDAFLGLPQPVIVAPPTRPYRDGYHF